MKYALVHNNQIKVGPRDYHKAFFEDYLREINNDQYLPMVYESSEVIHIADKLDILPVSEPVIPAHNTLTEQLAGPYYDITTTIIHPSYEIAPVPLDAVKNTLKAKLAENRYNLEVSGTKTTIQSKELTLDTGRGDDRNIWFQALFLLPEGSTQNFKFPKEQVWLELSKAEIQQIVTAIMTHVQMAFEWEATKIAEIDAATTKEELEAIDIAEKKTGANPIVG